MSDLTSQVKKIIAEQLGVEEDKITGDAALLMT